MDTKEVRECIVRLNEEIEEVLQKAGYPKCIRFSPKRGADAEMETEDILSHLGYINSVVKKWREQ